MFLSLLSYIVLYQPRWSSRGIVFMTKPYVSSNWEERINLIKHVSFLPIYLFIFLSGGGERGACVYVISGSGFLPSMRRKKISSKLTLPEAQSVTPESDNPTKGGQPQEQGGFLLCGGSEFLYTSYAELLQSSTDFKLYLCYFPIL